MRGLRLGLGLGSGRGTPPAFSVSFTGLSTDSLGTYGQIGNHASIGYTITPDLGTETVKWSNSSNPADAATYGTGANPTDFTASDESTVYLHVTDDPGDGAVTRSFSFPVRYAPGSVTESTLSDWTIDDDVLNVNLASDFTTTNLTGAYVITGLPSGAVDDGDGTISGTADGTPETANITATFTDQYGRTIVGSYTVDTVYRTQATGGTDLDLSFPEDSAITSTDLIANWTDNGNTLTFVSVSPTLPTGLSIASNGTMTGTPTTVTADATYTLTMQDEYGRQTSDTFTLEITDASFSPLDLFGGAEAGAWYDPSDLSTLWQDTAGTTAVTADGQSVARIDDKSGNGRHLTQSTSGKRPLYKTSGGLHWLEFDGADDHLVGSGADAQLVGPWDFFAAVNITVRSSTTTNVGLFVKAAAPASIVGSANTEGMFVRSDTGNELLFVSSRIATGTTYFAQLSSAFTISTAFVARASAEASDIRITSPAGNASASAVYTGTPGNTSYRIGHDATGPGFRFYGGVAIDRLLGTTEAANLTTYLEGKAGL